VTPSIELAASIVVIGARGIAQPSGNPQTTSQGIRMAPSSISSTSAPPQIAACSVAGVAPVAARRHTARPSVHMPQANSTRAPSLTVQPNVWNVITSIACATTVGGASQPV